MNIKKMTCRRSKVGQVVEKKVKLKYLLVTVTTYTTITILSKKRNVVLK